MTTLTFPGLSPEGIRVMTDVLAHTPREEGYELSSALRTHEALLRWWQALREVLARGLEGTEARTLLGVQISLCDVDSVFLQVALSNAADAPQPADAEKAQAALAETQEIEVKARKLLRFAGVAPVAPSEGRLGQGMAAYERGETEDLKEVVARLEARRSS
jgi:hypothetical protein